MLDYKAISIRQTFKLFKRVDNYIHYHFKEQLREDNSEADVFVSSHGRQQIIEDIVDIYLNYLYDK